MQPVLGAERVRQFLQMLRPRLHRAAHDHPGVGDHEPVGHRYGAQTGNSTLGERDGSAHIVYRGEATDVAVQGTLLGWDGSDRN